MEVREPEKDRGGGMPMLGALSGKFTYPSHFPSLESRSHPVRMGYVGGCGSLLPCIHPVIVTGGDYAAIWKL